LQLGGEQDLVLETLEIHAGREIGRQHFHDDTTTEGAFLGEEHAAHATASELAFDAIGTGQRALQPISKIDVQVLNLRVERSREEGRYLRSTLTAAARAAETGAPGCRDPGFTDQQHVGDAGRSP
jgi:hypothetical protein